MKRAALALLLLLAACGPAEPPFSGLVVSISAERYPEAAQAVRKAQEDGLSSICTLDRENADTRRSEALNGHRIEEGYNRMQYPFATCSEGGEVADVSSISKKASRSFGAWWGNQIRDLPDGTAVKVEVVQ